jgi:hypothetical protein
LERIFTSKAVVRIPTQNQSKCDSGHIFG